MCCAPLWMLHTAVIVVYHMCTGVLPFCVQFSSYHCVLRVRQCLCCVFFVFIVRCCVVSLISVPPTTYPHTTHTTYTCTHDNYLCHHSGLATHNDNCRKNTCSKIHQRSNTDRTYALLNNWLKQSSKIIIKATKKFKTTQPRAALGKNLIA